MTTAWHSRRVWVSNQNLPKIGRHGDSNWVFEGCEEAQGESRGRFVVGCVEGYGIGCGRCGERSQQQVAGWLEGAAGCQQVAGPPAWPLPGKDNEAVQETHSSNSLQFMFTITMKEVVASSTVGADTRLVASHVDLDIQSIIQPSQSPLLLVFSLLGCSFPCRLLLLRRDRGHHLLL